MLKDFPSTTAAALAPVLVQPKKKSVRSPGYRKMDGGVAEVAGLMTPAHLSRAGNARER
jgi:hypothetical protein